MFLFNNEQRSELWYTLKSNKKRSIVTSLGVFAGMFFFTVLISIGNGIGNSAFSSLEGVSNNSIFFMPGRTTMPYQGYKANRQIITTYRDFLNIKSQNKTLDTVSGFAFFTEESQSWGSMEIRANSKSQSSVVAGVPYDYFTEINKVVVVHGRAMSPEEVDNNNLVCMVGIEMAKNFYDDPADIVGTYIEVSGIAMRVVGVVTPFSDNFNMGFSIKYSVQIPMGLAIKNNYDKQTYIIGIPRQGFTTEEARKDVFDIIARRQNIHPEDSNVIMAMSMEVFMNIFDMIGTGINLLIWVVGMGTLITGVISVSNILLVTVRERQREIGVRRAIGAKPSDIRGQFMAEALVIIIIAGMLGIILGLMVALGIGSLAEVTPLGNYITRPYPTPGILLLSVVIMVVAGVLAGLLPVYKALQIKAIDAIRDE
ncbi:ABC transporter permease [Porphyromonadaceae bacterium W3.11]|nr:ABC transporter permease [Porphyromonadaceae bacterium W3.11]